MRVEGLKECEESHGYHARGFFYATSLYVEM